jgi:hypothetical protein
VAIAKLVHIAYIQLIATVQAYALTVYSATSVTCKLTMVLALSVSCSNTTANPDDEQLVDAHVFRFSFLQTGFFATTAGLLVYFVVRTTTSESIIYLHMHSRDTTATMNT